MAGGGDDGPCAFAEADAGQARLVAPGAEGNAIAIFKEGAQFSAGQADGLGVVALLKQADRLQDAVCVVNGVSAHGAPQSFSEAQVAAEGMGLAVSPKYLMHRKVYATALAKGLGATEFEPKKDAKKAADEVKELWEYLNERNHITSKAGESAP